MSILVPLQAGVFWLCGQPSAFRGFCSNGYSKICSVSYESPYRHMVTFGMLTLIMWRAVSFLILSSETPCPARSLAFSFFAIAQLNPLKLSELSIQHAAICLCAGWAGLCTSGHRTATGGYKTYWRERSAVAFCVNKKETKVELLFLTSVVLVAGCDVAWWHVPSWRYFPARTKLQRYDYYPSDHLRRHAEAWVVGFVVVVYKQCACGRMFCVSAHSVRVAECFVCLHSVRVAESFVFLRTVCMWPSVLCFCTQCVWSSVLYVYTHCACGLVFCMYTVCVWPYASIPKLSTEYNENSYCQLSVKFDKADLFWSVLQLMHFESRIPLA
jgi:hypothetical protein